MPSLDNTADEKPAIDPILQKVLDAVPFRLSTDDGVDAARQRFRDLPRRPLHPELRVEDRAIPGPAGPIAIRIYWPPSASDANADDPAPPVVLYFHGGGFVVGDLDTHDGTARQHAVGADAIVVSVDYRLAPEHPYPAAVEDAWAATLWAAEHGRRARRRPEPDGRGRGFGRRNHRARRWHNGRAITADRHRVPAVVVSLHDVGRRRCRPSPRTPPRRSSTSRPSPSSPVGTRAKSTCPTHRRAWRRGGPKNLADLPPAYIAVAGHDPLRDDGIRYGELLAAAGVPVEVHNAETLVHGYLGYAGVVPAATAAMERGLAALRTALHR